MTKQQLMQKLNDIRVDLWHTLEKLDDDQEIYPGWKKREFFAHISGWDAMIFEVLQRHLAQQTPKVWDYKGVDALNDYFVAMRQEMPLYETRMECEINRFAMNILLERVADFDEILHLPWGTETVSKFVEGAIEHERLHHQDIKALV